MSITTLGHPSRTAAVEALRKRGLTTREIADEIGITPKNVTALEYSMVRAPRTPGAAIDDGDSRVKAITFSMDTLARLMPHARRRDMTLDGLVRAIVDQVVEDRLVDAVLDDREG